MTLQSVRQISVLEWRKIHKTTTKFYGNGNVYVYSKQCWHIILSHVSHISRHFNMTVNGHTWYSFVIRLCFGLKVKSRKCWKQTKVFLTFVTRTRKQILIISQVTSNSTLSSLLHVFYSMIITHTCYDIPTINVVIIFCVIHALFIHIILFIHNTRLC